jgi:hypothetical protein
MCGIVITYKYNINIRIAWGMGILAIRNGQSVVNIDADA